MNVLLFAVVTCVVLACAVEAVAPRVRVAHSKEMWKTKILRNFSVVESNGDVVEWTANCTSCAVFVHSSYVRVYIADAAAASKGSLGKAVVEVHGECHKTLGEFCVVAVSHMPVSQRVVDGVHRHLTALRTNANFTAYFVPTATAAPATTPTPTPTPPQNTSSPST